MVITKTTKDLKDVLMDPSFATSKESSFMIRAQGEESLIVVNPGKNGIEYNKTFGYFHSRPQVEVYRCLYGHGVLVLQRNDDQGNVKEVRIVGLRPGYELEIPSGWGACLVNTGKTFLAVIINSEIEEKYHNLDHLRQKRGFCYYLVEKKGEIAVEKNPNYSYHPEVTF